VTSEQLTVALKLRGGPHQNADQGATSILPDLLDNRLLQALPGVYIHVYSPRMQTRQRKFSRK
jgi:hypothetical protein